MSNEDVIKSDYNIKPDYSKIRKIDMEKSTKGRVKESSVFIDVTNKPAFTTDIYYEDIHDIKKQIKTINRNLKNMKAKSWKKYKNVSKFR